MTGRPIVYFVSIHERDLSGPTIFAGHFEAADAAGARAIAIKQFLTPAHIPLDTLLDAERRFLQLVDETRERCKQVGYVAIARRSKADPDNVIAPRSMAAAS